MNLIDKFLVRLFRRMKGLDQEERYGIYRNTHDIHPTFRFNGPGIQIEGKGKVKLGAHSYLGMNSLLLPEENCVVEIGSFCSISHEFVVYTKNLSADQDLSAPKDRWKTKSGSVTIGDYCWIGFRVFIKEGVKIGNNVVIGAHSVVVSDLEDNGIYGGVPARLLRTKALTKSDSTP